MIYKFKRSSKFKKDFKKLEKDSQFDIAAFISILERILSSKKISPKHNNHKLKGEFSGCMECHIQPDVLLIYSLDKKSGIVNLLRIGSHSNLF